MKSKMKCIIHYEITDPMMGKRIKQELVYYTDIDTAVDEIKSWGHDFKFISAKYI